MTLWLLVAAVLFSVLLWVLTQLPHHKVQDVAWLRAARDSAVLVEGMAQALHGGASLFLSLGHALLLSFANGSLWLHGALNRPGRRPAQSGAEKPVLGQPEGGKWKLWRRL